MPVVDWEPDGGSDRRSDFADLDEIQMSKYEGKKRIQFTRNKHIQFEGENWKDEFHEGEHIDVTLRDYDDDNVAGATVTFDYNGRISKEVPVECFDVAFDAP